MESYKNKIPIIVLLLLLLTIIASCQNNSTLDNKNNKAETDSLPLCKNDDIYLYHHFEERLLTYNTNSQAITDINNRSNYYQFNFWPHSIYSSGNVDTNQFSVISINKDKITELLKVEKDEALYPLASSGDTYFFVHYYFEEGTDKEIIEKREICRAQIYDNNISVLEAYKNIPGDKFTHGVCIGNLLYYSTFNLETDSFTISAIDWNNLNNKPYLVKSDVVAPDLYEYSGELVTSDYSYIYINNNRFKKNSINYIISNTLVQIGPNSNGDLSFNAINILDGKEFYKIDNIIDIKLSVEKKLRLFGEGYINEIDIF